MFTRRRIDFNPNTRTAATPENPPSSVRKPEEEKVNSFAASTIQRSPSNETTKSGSSGEVLARAISPAIVNGSGKGTSVPVKGAGKGGPPAPTKGAGKGAPPPPVKGGGKGAPGKGGGKGAADLSEEAKKAMEVAKRNLPKAPTILPFCFQNPTIRSKPTKTNSEEIKTKSPSEQIKDYVGMHDLDLISFNDVMLPILFLMLKSLAKRDDSSMKKLLILSQCAALCPPVGSSQSDVQNLLIALKKEFKELPPSLNPETVKALSDYLRSNKKQTSLGSKLFKDESARQAWQSMDSTSQLILTESFIEKMKGSSSSLNIEGNYTFGGKRFLTNVSPKGFEEELGKFHSELEKALPTQENTPERIKEVKSHIYKMKYGEGDFTINALNVKTHVTAVMTLLDFISEIEKGFKDEERMKGETLSKFVQGMIKKHGAEKIPEQIKKMKKEIGLPRDFALQTNDTSIRKSAHSMLQERFELFSSTLGETKVTFANSTTLLEVLKKMEVDAYNIRTGTRIEEFSQMPTGARIATTAGKLEEAIKKSPFTLTCSVQSVEFIYGLMDMEDKDFGKKLVEHFKIKSGSDIDPSTFNTNFTKYKATIGSIVEYLLVKGTGRAEQRLDAAKKAITEGKLDLFKS